MNPQQYIKDIQSGKIPANKHVKLAIDRHVNDLKTCKKRGIYFDEEAGMQAISFFSLLKHYKGAYAGSPFELLPWQSFIIYSLFGWKRNDGTRRFRYAYIKVSRKNGKTTLSAGICLLCLIADGEQGAEIYTGATTRAQAKIAFDDAKEMIQNNPHLKEFIDLWKDSIVVPSTASKMQPVSSEAKNLDGLNPHLALIDEYHAHRDAEVYNVMKSGMGSRRQPLHLTITTAGFNKMSPCFQLEKTCQEILEGIKKDDSQFAIMYGLDEDDDYLDESCWIKANPSLGATPTVEFLRQEVQQAQNNPTELVNLKTKNFNYWTDASQTWIEDKAWLKCQSTVNDEQLKYMKCVGGLDLASTRDLTAFSLEWLDEETGKYISRTWYWLPREQMMARVKRDGVRYDMWVEEGWIKLTEGNTADYRTIKKDILEICTTYTPEAIAYDRFNSSQLVIELGEEGLRMEQYGQGFVSMSAPSKAFEVSVYEGSMSHDGNPVDRWCLSNVELAIDPAGNIKPDKKKSAEKIDGIVAKIMARGISIILYGELAENGPSKYEEEGGLFSI